MAKRRSRRIASKKRTIRLPHGLVRLVRRLSPGAYAWTAGFVAFTILCYWLFPPELPGWMQKLLGLGCAILGLTAYLQVTKEPDLETDLLSRVRRGQHTDFGKQLRVEREVRRHVTLPLLGETTFRAIGAVVVFLALVLWWWTPLAPVGVAQSRMPDVSEPLAAEITSLRLVFPDGQIPLAEPPVVPTEARRRAEKMPKHADTFQRALQAIALERFDQARHLLAQAVVEEREEPIRIQIARAWTEMYAGRFAEAVVRYRDAVIARPDDPDVLCQAAVASIHAGDHAEAMRLVLKALTEARQRGDADSPMVGVCLHHYAVVNVLAGRRLDQAKVYNDQAQKIFSSALGPGSSREAACLNNQSVFHSLVESNYPAARNLGELAVRFWQIEDAKGPYPATGLANLATCGYLEGMYVAARKRSDEGLAIRYNTSRPRTAPVVFASMGAAAIDLALGDYEVASPIRLKSFVAALEETLGPRHPGVAAAMNLVARSYAARSLYAPAESYYLQSLRILRDSLGADHAYLIPTLLELAEVQLLRGRHEDADKTCREAEDIARLALASDHALVGRCLGLRGRIPSALGESPSKESSRLLEKALAIAEAEYPENSLRLAGALALAAASDESRGIDRHERAIKICREALGESFGENPDAARFSLGLARHYLDRGQYAEAETWINQARAIGEEALVPFHPMLAEILETEARIVGRRSKPDAQRAAELERQAESIRKKHAEENRREESGTL
ncbi:MAG: tetratricopeptide repeat protein [Pirellulaceae bacterium]|nr:tetratricopeptide repeat protein [Pirellulaceae bacterium]